MPKYRFGSAMALALRASFLTLAISSFLTLTTLSRAFGKGTRTPTPTPTATPTPIIDGRGSFAAPIMDSAGNLYGTTALGGANANGAPQGDGTVFKLTLDGAGGWTESIVHSFNGTDGKAPEAALVIDGSGNLFGTTISGGASNGGTVFELSPPAMTGGAWTESVLLSFNGTNGSHPHDALLMDSAGNLYATAQQGGTKGYGTVVKLTKSGTTWTQSVLHSFAGGLSDGATPLYASLVMDTFGNLYGMTTKGGANSAGTVFKLTPPSGAGGTWTESVFWNFASGAGPADLKLFVASGNLYGIAGGGTYGQGTVFMLPLSGGAESILYNFTGGLEGSGPKAVIADTSGNLFGTTTGGGAFGFGTVFELSAGGVYSVLHSFNGTDGNDPECGLFLDGSTGNLYGTTTGGGSTGGNVFELSAGGAYSVLHSFK